MPVLKQQTLLLFAASLGIVPSSPEASAYKARSCRQPVLLRFSRGQKCRFPQGLVWHQRL